MVGLERLAVVGVGEQHVVVHHHLERQVGGVAAVRIGHDVLALGLDPRLLEQVAQEHAAPRRVELAPAGHAVDVHHHVRLRQVVQLLPGELQLVLHLSVELEVPAREVELGIRPDGEHREALREVLPGRDPRRVDSELLRLALAALAQYARGHSHRFESQTREGSTEAGPSLQSPSAVAGQRRAGSGIEQ